MNDQQETETKPYAVWLPLTSTDLVATDSLPENNSWHVWVIVLAARGIPYQIAPDQPEWHLLVPEELLPDAIREVKQYEDENSNWPPSPPPSRPLDVSSYTTLSILILLAAFHNFIRSDIVLVNGSYPDWFSLGMAQAAKILAGEWWRLVTALTLHADLQHLLGNLAIGGIFIYLLCRELGSGLAWMLLLGAGILGNLANAYLHISGHSSVGASTAVFGVVGLLAGLSMRRYHHYLWWRWFVPVAAAFSLLVLLGSEGKNTDLGAHLFGLLAGLILGFLAEIFISRYGTPGCRVNLLLGLLNSLVITTAWWMALT